MDLHEYFQKSPFRREFVVLDSGYFVDPVEKAVE